jgi:hypothetical protein
MKYIALTSTLVTLAFSGTSQAAISLYGDNLGDQGIVLTDADGSPLPEGSVIRVGFFNDPVADIAILSGFDFSAINDLFKPLGEGAIRTAGKVTDGALGIATPPGNFTFRIENIDQSYLPPGKQLFYWVFNSSNPSTATQWALFTNDDTNGGASPWTAPVDDPAFPGTATLEMPLREGVVDDASDMITGSLVGGTIQLRPIPEPSLAALCLSAGALFFRRRRAS